MNEIESRPGDPFSLFDTSFNFLDNPDSSAGSPMAPVDESISSSSSPVDNQLRMNALGNLSTSQDLVNSFDYKSPAVNLQQFPETPTPLQLPHTEDMSNGEWIDMIWKQLGKDTVDHQSFRLSDIDLSDLKECECD